MTEQVRLRATTAEDVPTLLKLIKAFRTLPYRVVNSPADTRNVTTEELIRDGFGEKPFFTCLLLELIEDGKPPQAIGYTLYFFTYSTCAGRVLFMEDLFVLAEHHRKGYGTRILKHLSKLALEHQCQRLSWQGNQAWDSGKFYVSMGAQCNSVWSDFMLDVEGMTDLIGQQ